VSGGGGGVREFFRLALFEILGGGVAEGDGGGGVVGS